MKTECDIPDQVVISAIRYNVVVKDDMVLFSEAPGVAGCYSRLVITRAYGCWHVELLAGHVCGSPHNRVMVSHILAAQECINEWFGGNHDSPRGEHVP